MSFLVKLGLILSLLASLASCFTKFLRPPEWDPDQEVDRDMTKNYQYDDGESIPILFNTNIKKVDVYILQVQGDENSEWGFFNVDGELDTISWTAEYDIFNVTQNKEDCVYWFRIVDSKYRGILAESQYVNVTASKAEETKTITAYTASTTLTAETPTSTTEATTSTTNASSGKESSSISEPSSKSGLSRGEIAGVAVGATIGGLLILGVIGWMGWRRRVRRKSDAAPAELPDNYNQDQPHSERPKSELPAEPVVFRSEGPRSPPIIYEAP